MATSTTVGPPGHELDGVIEALNAAVAGGNAGAPPISNAGMFPSPKSPYNSLSDQISDAFILSGVMPGMKTNPMGGNNVPRYDFKNAAPTLGGATNGTTAYSGFNPYLGRGNNVPGIFTPPGTTTTPPPPGSTNGSVTPRINPITGLPYTGGGTPAPGTPYQPTPNPGHPGGNNPTPPVLQPPNAPVTGHTQNPPPTVTGAPTPRSTSGIFPPPTSGGNNPVYPAPKYPIADLKVPGAVAGQTDPQSMANYFMSLPPDQQMNYFNAMSQYGLTTGQNLGGALDAALKQTMGAQQFAAWLQNKDNGQGSTITNTAGLPDWVIKGLGG